LVEEPVVTVPFSKSGRLNRLITRIGESRRAIGLEVQYETWRSSFEALLAEVKEASLLVDNAFREGWGGGLKLREFPIVDFETFRSIRSGQPYSRTWYFNLNLILPETKEDLVFFFGRASRHVAGLDPNLNLTASLGVARMVRRLGRYVNAHSEDWSSVKEITHDGAQMGLCYVKDRMLKHVPAEDPMVTDWFAVLMEDCTQVLGGYDLGNS
jgi:hypothetical protein